MKRLIVLYLLICISPLSANRSIIRNLAGIPAPSARSEVEGIDEVYFINLKERTEKWKQMKRKLAPLKLHYRKIDAVNGWNLSNWETKKVTGGLHKYDKCMNKGRVGCSLSHISIWYNALMRGLSPVWILEDDVNFLDQPQRLTNYLNKLESLDPEWDVLYTDKDTLDWDSLPVKATTPKFNHPTVITKDGNYYHQRSSLGEDFERVFLRWGAYSYIVSRKGLKKILDYHFKWGVWTAVDTSIHLVPGLRQYALKKALVTCDRENAISDTDHDPGDF